MRDMIRPTLVLFVICLIVGSLMAFTNYATADKIEQRILEDSENARKTVLPEADSFEKLDMEKLEKASGDSGLSTLAEAYAAKKSDAIIGYVFLAKPAGYGGEISMMIGINDKGQVSGVEIGDNTETPGLGSKAKDQEFRGQFYGKKYDVVNVVKRKPSTDDEIQAISGATITSRAVSLGVQQASQAADALLNNKWGVTANELIQTN